MRDYINIGPSPCDEECAQVGTEDYQARSKRECVVFEAQLTRVFGEPPEGAYLVIKSFPHDFGTYREVVCYFDDTYPESVAYAFKLEGEAPSKWDEQARAELAACPQPATR